MYHSIDCEKFENRCRWMCKKIFQWIFVFLIDFSLSEVVSEFVGEIWKLLFLDFEREILEYKLFFLHWKIPRKIQRKFMTDVWKNYKITRVKRLMSWISTNANRLHTILILIWSKNCTNKFAFYLFWAP